MSDNTFKKSPTAFLQNRLSMNRLIQNGSKKRIEKEIEYLKVNDESAELKSPFIEINKNLNQQVDGNKAVVDKTCPVWNPKLFKSDAKLRIKTPGFREGCGASKFEDAFYTSKARPQGIASTLGLNTSFVRTLKAATLQLDQATVFSVVCNQVKSDIIYVYLTAPNASSFYKYVEYDATHNSCKWESFATPGAYVYTYDEACKGDKVYSETALTDVIGEVNANYHPWSETAKAYGFLRSPELDDLVEGVQYYGWFYIGQNDTDFGELYTTKACPTTGDSLFIRDRRSGTAAQLPSVFATRDWTAPPTMFDVDYEYSGGGKFVDDYDVAKVIDLGEKVPIEIKPAFESVRYNVRMLVNKFEYGFKVNKFCLDSDNSVTYQFVKYEDGAALPNCASFVRVSGSSSYPLGLYASYVDYWNSGYYELFLDEDGEQSANIFAIPTEFNTAVFHDWLEYRGFNGNHSIENPEEIFLYTKELDHGTETRRGITLETYWGYDLNTSITEQWWQTTNIGYGEVSSQTTLYTETAYRYKDLDSYLSGLLPSDWEGNAYGCVILASSSVDNSHNDYSYYLGVSHSDFFLDGSDIYYILPTNFSSVLDGQNVLLSAYVYDAPLNSIYSTAFTLTETISGVATVYHYISDATGNYLDGDKWQYHYACIETKDKDLYARRLAYDFTDLYFLVNGKKVFLDKEKHTLQSSGTIPYAFIYEDTNYDTEGNCAWRGFKEKNITIVDYIDFTYQGYRVFAERAPGYDDYKGTAVMYAWEYDRDYYYTDVLVPVVGTTHVWRIIDGEWTDLGVTIADVKMYSNDWNCFYTSNLITAGSKIGPEVTFHEAIWSNDPYSLNWSVASNYSSEEIGVPTVPRTDYQLSLSTTYNCYVAPAYKITVRNAHGDEFTLTSNYEESADRLVYKGVLVSGWHPTREDSRNGAPYLFTLRITPKVGDPVWDWYGDFETGWEIVAVSSVTDEIYPGRK